MLSSGTRIGPSRIISWLGDGSCGQSYECIQTDGENKGEKVYAKLIHREISESKGFEDYFLQECQALEQLEGPGIWPIQKFGLMKWKHWIYYPWLQGQSMMLAKPSSPEEEEQEKEEFWLRSLADFLEHKPEEMSPDVLLEIMTFLHQAIHRAHLGGVVHGNLKPRNILVEWSGAGKVKAWVTEFGLWKMNAFASLGQEETEALGVSLNLDVQESVAEAVRSADLVVGAVLVPGAAAPKLVGEALVQEMQSGSALVDISIDQGGCFATSRPTSHDAPTYIEHDVVHYCVTNMPGAVARTATQALNNVTLPYVLSLANDGWRTALQSSSGFAAGLNISAGEVCHPAVAEALQLPATEQLHVA